MKESEPTPLEWYRQAARCYAEAFQGCPWCNTFNCVYRTERGARIEFECGECGFFTCHEQDPERYFMTPGHPRQGKPAPQTMHEM